MRTAAISASVTSLNSRKLEIHNDGMRENVFIFQVKRLSIRMFHNEMQKTNYSGKVIGANSREILSSVIRVQW